MKMKLINKTPHNVDLLDADNNIIRTYERDNTPIRLSVTLSEAEPLEDGTRTTRTIFGEATGLPTKKEGTYYIVSQLVQTALPSRQDLLVPAEIVRDESGTIIGCRSFGRS